MSSKKPNPKPKKQKQQNQIIRNLTGYVAWFNDEQGRGRITDVRVRGIKNLQSIYVTTESIKSKNKTLRPNAHVSLDVEIDKEARMTAINVKIIEPYLKLYYGQLLNISSSYNGRILLENNKNNKICYFNKNDLLNYCEIGSRVEFEKIFDNDLNKLIAYNIKCVKNKKIKGKIIQLFVNKNNINDGYGIIQDNNGIKYDFNSQNIINDKFELMYEDDEVTFIPFGLTPKPDQNGKTRNRQCINVSRINKTDETEPNTSQDDIKTNEIQPNNNNINKNKENKIYYGTIKLIKNNIYGFIKPNNIENKQDLYFKCNNIIFNIGDNVMFNIKKNEKKNKIEGYNVKRVNIKNGKNGKINKKNGVKNDDIKVDSK